MVSGSQVRVAPALGKSPYRDLEDENQSNPTSTTSEVDSEIPSRGSEIPVEIGYVQTHRGHRGPVRGLSQNSTSWFSGSMDSTVGRWDFGGSMSVMDAQYCCASQVLSVCCIGEELVVAGCENGSIQVWDIAKGERVAAMLHHTGKPVPIEAGSSEPMSALAGSMLTPMGSPVQDDERNVFSLLYVPDFQFLLSGGGDGVVRVWDMSWRCRHHFESHVASVMKLVPNPSNSAEVFSCSIDRTVSRFNLHSFECTQTIPAGDTGPVLGLSASPGRLAFTCRNNIAILDVETGDRVPSFISQGHRFGTSVYCLEQLYQGQVLLSAGQDGTLQAWDSDTGNQLCSVCEHQREVMALMVVHREEGGSFILTGSGDRTVKRWAFERSVSLDRSTPPFVVSSRPSSGKSSTSPALLRPVSGGRIRSPPSPCIPPAPCSPCPGTPTSFALSNSGSLDFPQPGGSQGSQSGERPLL